MKLKRQRLLFVEEFLRRRVFQAFRWRLAHSFQIVLKFSMNEH